MWYLIGAIGGILFFLIFIRSSVDRYFDQQQRDILEELDNEKKE